MDPNPIPPPSPADLSAKASASVEVPGEAGTKEGPPVSPAKPKNRLIILLIILVILLSLGAAGFLAYQYIQLKNQISHVKPTPTITLSPTPDVTADWGIINMKECSTRNANFEYSIKTPDGWMFSKTEDNIYRTVYKLTEGQNSRIEINCDTAGIGSIICLNGGEADHPFQIGSVTQDGCYWTADPNTEGYGAEYTVHNPFGAFVITAYGVEKTLLDQILSTFTFITEATPIPTDTVSNAKMLIYTLPTGWTKISDPTSRFEAAYDPTNTKLLEAGVEGLNLTKKQLNDNGIGYKSFISIRLYPYDGGSRHQFIYKYMSNSQPPQKQDLGSDYTEKEYLFNNKSCLFLRGIYTSQMPTVWGMCDAGGGSAFLITSYDPDYETTVQTIRLLN